MTRLSVLEKDPSGKPLAAACVVRELSRFHTLKWWLGVQLPLLSLLPVPVKAGAPGLGLQVIYTKLKIHLALLFLKVSASRPVNALVYSKISPALIQLPLCPGCHYFRVEHSRLGRRPINYSINILILQKCERLGVDQSLFN